MFYAIGKLLDLVGEGETLPYPLPMVNAFTELKNLTLALEEEYTKEKE